MTVVSTGLTTVAPVSMAPTPDGKVLVVNGYARGAVVLGGATAYPIGITAAPQVTATTVTSPQYYYVSNIEIFRGGENYYAPPNVSIAGVTGARASLLGDAVGSITITTSATTHTFSPPVYIYGNQASGASAKAILRGSVVSVSVRGGSPYLSGRTINFSAGLGVTEIDAAQARINLRRATYGATQGDASSVLIEDGGVYEWDGDSAPTRPVGATVTGGAILRPQVSGTIHALTLISGGSNYSVPPAVVITSQGSLREGGGAAAVASLDNSGAVTSLAILSPGSGYSGRVDVRFQSQQASAIAVMQPRLSGRYLLGVRYVASDGTTSDLGPLRLVDCGDRASSFTWDLPGAGELSARGGFVELWRTTADQAITLYRVARLSAGTSGTYTEGLTDAELTNPERADYLELPILTDEGLPNAYRFGVPPAAMSVVTLFADRAWYAVDRTGAEPNVLYFSGVQEYESVPAENQLVLQNIGREADVITGLMPMAGVLYVGQRRTLVRVTVGDNPLLSASAVPAAQRGMLNDRCWDQFEGVAYVADSAGVYAFDGSGSDPISDPVATFWTAGTVDFSKQAFFFLRVDADERVVRFYFSATGQTGEYPKSALCFSLTTKAWWLEEYAIAVSCGVRVQRSSRMAELVGANGRLMQINTGLTDDGAAISYAMRTGSLPLNNDQKRGVRVLYTPTASSHSLNARLYYNNAATPRANAIANDRGTGFVTTTGSTQATLDMAASRSPLGPASGLAQFTLSGRLDDRSVGADRHVAVELAGEQTTTRPIIHRLEVEGAG